MTRTAGILVVASLLAGCHQHGSKPDASPPRPQGIAEAPPQIPFTVTSDIPDCLEVSGNRSHADSNLLLAEVRLTSNAITAQCGCISKWLLYRSVTSTDGLETELASGSLLAPEPGAGPIERQVLLHGDREHLPALPLIVHVGCAPAP